MIEEVHSPLSGISGSQHGHVESQNISRTESRSLSNNNTQNKDTSLIRQSSRGGPYVQSGNSTSIRSSDNLNKRLVFADAQGGMLVEKTLYSDQLYYSPANEDFAAPVSRCCIIQ
mmetsp:Transcript_38785/g.51107  ORF Transcript_38785/g.51107 Transcript_38785/m.51107 type:complete len:115 (-) Transcript_38785:334-678(-)